MSGTLDLLFLLLQYFAHLTLFSPSWNHTNLWNMRGKPCNSSIEINLNELFIILFDLTKSRIFPMKTFLTTKMWCAYVCLCVWWLCLCVCGVGDLVGLEDPSREILTPSERILWRKLNKPFIIIYLLFSRVHNIIGKKKKIYENPTKKKIYWLKISCLLARCSF